MERELVGVSKKHGSLFAEHLSDGRDGTRGRRHVRRVPRLAAEKEPLVSHHMSNVESAARCVLYAQYFTATNDAPQRKFALFHGRLNRFDETLEGKTND